MGITQRQATKPDGKRRIFMSRYLRVTTLDIASQRGGLGPGKRGAAFQAFSHQASADCLALGHPVVAMSYCVFDHALC